MADDVPDFEASSRKGRGKGAKLSAGQQLLRGAVALAIIGVFCGGLYYGLQALGRANEPAPAPIFPLAKNSASKLLVPLTMDSGRFRRVEVREADTMIGAWAGYTLGGGSDWTGKNMPAYRTERTGSGQSLAFVISTQTEPQNGAPCAIILLRADDKTAAGEYKLWLTQRDAQGGKIPLPLITVNVK